MSKARSLLNICKSILFNKKITTHGKYPEQQKLASIPE
jgi:hypothetical protein